MNNQKQYLFLFALFLLLAFPCAHAADVATGVTIIVVPDAPSNFTAVPDSQTQVTLSWTDNSNNTEDGFSVERKTGVSGTYSVIGTTATGVVTYVDNTASAATTYFYRVRAFSGNVFSLYSNEASVTTPSQSIPPVNPISSGGGGGGGGGGVYVVPPASTNNNVTITGWAYPLSTVTILQNGVQILQTIAGSDGVFSGSVSDFPNGAYNFYLYATDSTGRKSSPFTFPVDITTGATTNVGGVFLSPTIGVDKQEVKKGDPITIFGQSLPDAPIKIEVDSAVPIFINTTSTENGIYIYDLDSSQLEVGPHVAKSQTAIGGLLSNYGVAQAFTVGDENIPAAQASSRCPIKGDFDGDCRVNLVDFSILAYWYGQPTAPAMYRFDGAPVVDLRDFSILAYYWTG